MRKETYLNAILTVNALLLAVLAWTQLAGQAPLVRSVDAQSVSGGGMVNAAEQRQRMIESLRDVHQSVNETNRLLGRGQLRVHVVNTAEMRGEKDEKQEARGTGN